MGKRPNLDALNDLFKKGQDFQLSDRRYEEITGASLPKGKYYLLSNSALAKKAKDKGYEITAIEEKPVIERTIYFTRREK